MRDVGEASLVCAALLAAETGDDLGVVAAGVFADFVVAHGV